MPASFIVGQQNISGEIRVLSRLVGATIDIPEEEYYSIFDNPRGFLSAQFVETSGGFQARILTERGWITRSYSPREFYDLGLAIDLMGPIDSTVWIELSGQRIFEETAASMTELPPDVRMILMDESGKFNRGLYQEFRGHYFYLKDRLGREKQVPLEGQALIWYREYPLADLKKDARIHAGSALLGMLIADGWNRIFDVDDFDSRWSNRFIGGLCGLCCSPFIVNLFRIYRAPTHLIRIPRETRDKINTYAYLTFN